GVRLDGGLAPRRAASVAADGDLALAVGLAPGGGHDVGAGGLLGVGRDGVLEVEDQRIGRQAARLLERTGIGARHVEDAAARTNGLRHEALPKPRRTIMTHVLVARWPLPCASFRFRAMLPTAMSAIGRQPFPFTDWASRSGRQP